LREAKSLLVVAVEELRKLNGIEDAETGKYYYRL